jgi:hypothetical protein
MLSSDKRFGKLILPAVGVAVLGVALYAGLPLTRSTRPGVPAAQAAGAEAPAPKAVAAAPKAAGALGTDSDHDGLPDAVEKTLGTNPHAADTDGDGQPDKTDPDPLYAPDPLKETSTTPAPVKVLDSRVEDNSNAADHLEIRLANTGKSVLNDFEVYFTVSDRLAPTKKEGYYVKLTRFGLQPGETKTLHFDNRSGDGHFPGNPYGLYGTSRNELEFRVRLHAQGYAVREILVKKAKGTAEVAD